MFSLQGDFSLKWLYELNFFVLEIKLKKMRETKVTKNFISKIYKIKGTPYGQIKIIILNFPMYKSLSILKELKIQ